MKIKDKIKSIFRNGAQECVVLNYSLFSLKISPAQHTNSSCNQPNIWKDLSKKLSVWMH